MKFISTFLPVLLMFSFASCEKNPGEIQPKTINLPLKGKEVIEHSNSFGINLFRESALAEKGNMMLSPLSASTALSMLLNGCSSQTYDQIRDMLGYEGLTMEEINTTYNSLVGQLLEVDPKVTLALANAVFYRQDYPFKLPFLGVMDQSFDAEIAGLDFSSPSALKTINDWASDNTNGKIPKVLDEINPELVMFLMNALYFKGLWTFKFKESDSYQDSFYTSPGQSATVYFMNGLIPARLVRNDHAVAAELTYGTGNYSMVIVVPQGPLGEYLDILTDAEWSDITTGLDAITDTRDITVILPRFKFSFEKYLNDQLTSLGMVDAFIPGLADLSGISDNDLFVSFVKQNTFVEVNEKGTEAAAVTTIGVGETSYPGDDAIFKADKPFIFAIRERTTNTLLFIGKVELPVE